MGFRDQMDFLTLLELQKRLRFMDFDGLNLRNLEPLRFEVDMVIRRRIEEAKNRLKPRQDGGNGESGREPQFNRKGAASMDNSKSQGRPG